MGKEGVLLPGGWGLGPAVSCSSAPRAVIALLRLAAACLPGLLGAVGADSPPQTPRTAFECFGRKLSWVSLFAADMPLETWNWAAA